MASIAAFRARLQQLKTNVDRAEEATERAISALSRREELDAEALYQSSDSDVESKEDSGEENKNDNFGTAKNDEGEGSNKALSAEGELFPPVLDAVAEEGVDVEGKSKHLGITDDLAAKDPKNSEFSASVEDLQLQV